jgi:hypothetical protein
MEITSQAPGNLFNEGQPLKFRVKGASEGSAFEVKDFWGKERAKVFAKGGELTLPALPPGWYELKGLDASAFLGVVIDRGNKPLPKAGRVCADAASAWLIHDDSQRAPFAKMVRMAGIPWLRERIRWSDVEPKEGTYHWGRYDKAVDSLAAEGIRISEIWHDSPPWTRPEKAGADKDARRNRPEDLRAMYRFAKAAARHFRGKVQAWEVWNEPDIFFWPELADRFGGTLKAAALGIKDGDPRALVLQGALCSGVTAFASHWLETKPGDAFDIFNWHIYKEPADYPAELAGYRKLFDQYGAAQRPAWISECGIRLDATEGQGKRLLDQKNLDAQARFMPQSVAMSLASGNQKHFYFVLPDYLEGTNQFGALQPDLTPHPAFLALSAAANFLGLSTYLGGLAVGAAEVHAFKTSSGPLYVVWSKLKSPVALPTDRGQVEVADLFGARRQVKAKGGKVEIPAGPEAVYVLGAGNKMLKGMAPLPSPDLKVPVWKPSRLVVSAGCQLPYNKDSDQYQLGQDGPVKPFDYQVEAYNFGKKAAKADLKVDLPQGWKMEPTPGKLVLAAGERKAFTFRVTPVGISLASERLAVRLVPAKGPAQSSVSYLAFSQDNLKVLSRKPLAVEGAWERETGTAATIQSSKGDLKIEMRGDHWVTALQPFGDKGADFSAYDGIECELSADPAADDTVYGYLSLRLGDGRDTQTAGAMFTPKPARQVFLFRDMLPAGMSPKEVLKEVSAIRFGMWCAPVKVDAKIAKFSLVKMGLPK